MGNRVMFILAGAARIDVIVDAYNRGCSLASELYVGHVCLRIEVARTCVMRTVRVHDQHETCRWGNQVREDLSPD